MYADYYIRDDRAVMDTDVKMKTATRVLNLDGSVCIWHSAYTLDNSINQSLLSPVMVI